MPDLPVEAKGEPFTVTDAVSNSWGTDLMGLDLVRDKANADEMIQGQITVAVIDSGINNTHELFVGRLSSASTSFVSGSDCYTDTGGHGTHVAGIIADGTSGHVNILAIKALNEEGKGGFNEVINAIKYAQNQHVDVINMSLAINLNDYGNYWSDAAVAQEESALKSAEKEGIICVAAAGNDSKNMDVLKVYPAVSTHTITVSSIKENKERAASSNYGESVDFTAPGDLINSAGTNGRNDYCIKSGTSMAAPHITAACAMIKLYNRNASVQEVRTVLQEKAVDIGDTGKDKKYGYGYVQFSDGSIPVIKEASAPEEPITIKGTTVKKIKKAKKALTVKWNQQTAKTKDSNVTGYQIQLSTKSDFSANKRTVKVKGYKKTSKKITKLKAKKKYYVRVRTYMTYKGDTYYSSWSKHKLAKTK